MKRTCNCLIALLFALSVPVLIWVGAGSALYQGAFQSKKLARAARNLTCSIDADCPSGYVCVGGKCVPSS